MLFIMEDGILNINKVIKCIVCKSTINLRMQAGMINKNEIRFNCPECGIPINVTLEFVHKEDGFSIFQYYLYHRRIGYSY